MAKCKLCGGPLGELGTLGLLRHLQCRNCGMMFTKEIQAWKRKPKRVKQDAKKDNR